MAELGPTSLTFPRPAATAALARFALATAAWLCVGAAAIALPGHGLDADPIRLAESLLRRGDAARALLLARERLRHRPDDRRAILCAARSLSGLGRPDDAEAFYRRAGRLDLENLHARALGIVRANRREDAIRAYCEILERLPDDVLAHRRLAGVYISQTRYREALELGRRLVQIPEGRVIGHTLAGLIDHRTGYPEQAVAEFERVIALDPDLRQMPLQPPRIFWTAFASDLLYLGEAARVRSLLVPVAAGGRDPALAGLLGKACQQAGDLDEAGRWWARATQWAPDLPGPWLELGRLALARDRPDEAARLLRKAAELAPASPEPPYSLSIALRRLGQVEEADRQAALAAELRRKAGPPRGGMGPRPAPEGD